MQSLEYLNKRQVLYWRLLESIFKSNDKAISFNTMTAEIAEELQLPGLLLNNSIGIETLIERYPELEQEFLSLKDKAPKDDYEQNLRRILLLSKLLINTLGQNTQTPLVSAQQFQLWRNDVKQLERFLGFEPRTLLAVKGPGGQGSTQGDVHFPDLSTIENDMIKRMAIHEILLDDKLSKKLTPSMPLVEQLLSDKRNLSPKALQNAKAIIKRFIDQLAEILKTQVYKSTVGKTDYSVPPKRVFKNLDLKQTIWKNLPKYDQESKKLYVDRVYFKHTAKLKIPKRMIVVVDQSGSMVDAMVQCTILASIFSGLPNVDVHILAFDTRVLDLTPWVHDPFEVLMRTTLGGGTYIQLALQEASKKIINPKETVLVLISDFYEGGSDIVLLDYIKSIIESDVHFIPVGAVTSIGYFSVNPWFRAKLKDLKHPILTGSPSKLIQELKNSLA